MDSNVVLLTMIVAKYQKIPRGQSSVLLDYSIGMYMYQ